MLFKYYYLKNNQLQITYNILIKIYFENNFCKNLILNH